VPSVSRLILAHGIPFNEWTFVVIAAPMIWLVKFLGYYLAARWLCPRYPEVQVNPVVFAGLRALLGLCVGVLYYATAFPKATWWNEHPSPLPWYGTLTCLRLAEWLAVLWLFFGRHVGRPAIGRLVTHTLAGTMWSVALDFVIAGVVVPALIAAIATG